MSLRIFTPLIVFLCALPLGANVVTVVNQGPSPSVSLTWAQISSGKDTWIFRRTLPTGDLAESPYEIIAKVAKPGLSYVDATVLPGRSYSYLFASGSTTTADGVTTTAMENSGYHAIANIKPELIENRGTVLLVVEDTVGQSGELARELGLLEMDLAGDGWAVRRLEFARHEVDGYLNKYTRVKQLKAAIVAACAADPSINALYLFGRLPVARSGMSFPDGHTPSRAHESDHYYADIDGVWTDTTSWIGPTPVDPDENGNAPGDGKFDHVGSPSAIDLMTGRVDFSDLYYFRKSEHEMLRDYIQKSHAWRHGRREVPYRALWNSSYLREVRANFVTLFGEDRLTLAPFQPTLGTEPHVWAADFGHHTGTHDHYVNLANQAVFTFNFGSYKQMWKRPNNHMRGLMTQADWGLTSAWGGWPGMAVYQMAAGLPIGYAFRDSQNRWVTPPSSGEVPEGHAFSLDTRLAWKGDLRHYNNGVTGLMGDPTLRLHPVAPPRSLAAAADGATTVLSWLTPAEAGLAGFHVYRSTQRLGAYERLNGELLPAGATTFTDPERPAGDVYYQVRAVARTETLSGDYLNPSQAAFAWVRADGTANTAPVAVSSPVLAVQTNIPTEIVFAGSDADGDTLTPVVISNPASGTLRWSHGKAFYVSDLDYTGRDTFSYRLFDGVALSEPVVVELNVVTQRPEVLLAWQFDSGNTLRAGSTHARPGVAPATLARGPGLSSPGTTSSGNRDAYIVTGAGPAALDETGWIGWTVAPSSEGWKLSLDRVVFSAFAGVSSDKRQDYHPFKLRLRASTDGFATHAELPLDQPEAAVNNTAVGDVKGNGRYYSATLPDRPEFRNAAAPVEFRLYFWGASADNIGTGLGKSGDRAYQSAADLVIFGQEHAPAGTFGAWMEGIDWQGVDSAHDADADGDGLPNLLEYALGRDPLRADGTGAGSLGRDAATGRLTLTFTRIADPALTYAVEASTDLKTWTPVSVSTGAANVAGVVTVTDTDSAAVGRFLRLLVSVNGAPEAAASIPTGEVRLTLPANSDTHVGLPMVRPAVWTGRVASVDGNAIGLEGADFAPSALTYAPGIRSDTHYLQFLSGEAIGHHSTVLGNAANTVTTEFEPDLTGLIRAGDRVVIRPYWTLGTLLPSGDAGKSFVASTNNIGSGRRTEVLTLDRELKGINRSSTATYFHNGFWRRVGAVVTDHGDIPFSPDAPLVFRGNNYAEDTVLAIAGEVPPAVQMVPLITAAGQRNDNPVGLALPVGVSLDDLFRVGAGGVFEASTNNLGSGRGDEVLVFDPNFRAINKASSATYFHNGFWQRVGAVGTDSGADVLPAGGMVIIRRKAGATDAVADWSIGYER